MDPMTPRSAARGARGGDILHEGTLAKKGSSFFAGWGARWFSLSHKRGSASALLCYYAEQPVGDGTLPLGEIAIPALLPGRMLREVVYGGLPGLELRLAHRTYLLRAKTMPQILGWISAFNLLPDRAVLRSTYSRPRPLPRSESRSEDGNAQRPEDRREGGGQRPRPLPRSEHGHSQPSAEQRRGGGEPSAEKSSPDGPASEECSGKESAGGAKRPRVGGENSEGGEKHARDEGEKNVRDGGAQPPPPPPLEDEPGSTIIIKRLSFGSSNNNLPNTNVPNTNLLKDNLPNTNRPGESPSTQERGVKQSPRREDGGRSE
ncbi:hypothetical protein T484DRAFT_1885553, partial [Baffinella frigidus]